MTRTKELAVGTCIALFTIAVLVMISANYSAAPSIWVSSDDGQPHEVSFLHKGRRLTTNGENAVGTWLGCGSTTSLDCQAHHDTLTTQAFCGMCHDASNTLRSSCKLCCDVCAPPSTPLYHIEVVPGGCNNGPNSHFDTLDCRTSTPCPAGKPVGYSFSMAECSTKCLELPSCVIFQRGLHAGSQGTCWFYNQPDTSQNTGAENGWECGLKERAMILAPSVFPKFHMEVAPGGCNNGPDSDFDRLDCRTNNAIHCTDHGKKWGHSFTIEECKAHCLKLPTCLIFQRGLHNRHQGTCWFYNSPDTSANSGAEDGWECGTKKRVSDEAAMSNQLPITIPLLPVATWTDPIVIGGSLTFNEPDTAVFRVDVTYGQFDAWAGESKCRDKVHVTDDASYIVFQRGDSDNYVTGSVDVGTSWKTISFPDLGPNPFVFTMSQSGYRNGGYAATRIRNVNNIHFDIKLDTDELTLRNESSAGVQSEIIGYLVAKSGCTQAGCGCAQHHKPCMTKSGTHVIGGKKYTYEMGLVWSYRGRGRMQNVNFRNAFKSTPTALVNMQTTNGGDPAHTRVAFVTGEYLEFFIDEDTCYDSDRGHIEEWVAYYVIGEAAPACWLHPEQLYDGNANPTCARFSTLLQEKSRDPCPPGSVCDFTGVLAASCTGVGITRYSSACLEFGCSVADCTPSATLPAVPKSELGMLQINHQSKTVFSDLANSIIIGGAPTFNGHGAGVFRAQLGVGYDFKAWFGKPKCLAISHTDEDVGYFLSQRGYTTDFITGSVEVGGYEFITVSYPDHGFMPFVFATSQSGDKNMGFATPRLRNVNNTNFEVRLETDEKNRHDAGRAMQYETIGYVVIRSGCPTENECGCKKDHQPCMTRVGTHVTAAFSYTYEVGLVWSYNTYNNSLRWTHVEFHTTFVNPPMIFASMQTFNGGNPANVRVSHVTHTGFDFVVDEDNCRDEERKHISEWVAYWAMGEKAPHCWVAAETQYDSNFNLHNQPVDNAYKCQRFSALLQGTSVPCPSGTCDFAGVLADHCDNAGIAQYSAACGDLGHCSAAQCVPHTTTTTTTVALMHHMEVVGGGCSSANVIDKMDCRTDQQYCSNHGKPVGHSFTIAECSANCMSLPNCKIYQRKVHAGFVGFCEFYDAADSDGFNGGVSSGHQCGIKEVSMIVGTRTLTNTPIDVSVGWVYPIVISGPPTFVHPNAAVTRVQLELDKFKFYMGEPKCQIRWNDVQEDAGFIVFQRGSSADYTTGTIDVVGRWTEVSFDDVGPHPFVFTKSQSGDKNWGKNGGFSTTRLKEVTSSTFNVHLEFDEQTKRIYGSGQAETIGYVVVRSGCALAGCGCPTDHNACMTKTGKHVLGGFTYVYEAGLVYTKNSYQNEVERWVTVSMHATCSSTSTPVILADMQSFNGGNPAHIRLRHITKDPSTGKYSFELTVDEDHCGDEERKHISEWVAYYIMCEEEVSHAIIAQPDLNGKECGLDGDTHRVFDLRGTAATEAACTHQCKHALDCVAFSGIWNDWCIGCSTQLWQNGSPGSQAYLKVASPTIVPQPALDGKKCGPLGDSHQVFKLEDSAATEAVCKARCEVTLGCVAFSGIWDDWCVGCSKQLWEPWSGAKAYIKASSPSIIPEPLLDGQKCGSYPDPRRVFELSLTEASEAVCKATCEIIPDCVSVSGVWNEWCAGCSEQVDTHHSGPVAYAFVKAPLIIPQPQKDGTACGVPGSSHRVFDLRSAAATVEACTLACKEITECVAFSGIWGHWCIGCDKQLWQPHSSAAKAYLKADSPTSPTVISQQPLDGKQCGLSGDSRRVFDLRNADATEIACRSTCAITEDCGAVSGVWGEWCIGCKEQLDTDHAQGNGKAYLKVDSPSIVADVALDGKKCGGDGDVNRVFQLSNHYATEERCKATCEISPSCASISAVFGEWCHGCNQLPWAPQSDAKSYVKVAGIISQPELDGKMCGTDSNAAHRVVQLHGASASEANCKANCIATTGCVAFSGVWNNWCFGCSKQLWEPAAGALAYLKTTSSNGCTSTMHAKCQRFPCIDLREGASHHHLMWLNPDGTAHVDGEAWNADDREWTCYCFGTCTGLVGTWSCPGLYNGYITVTPDFADDFTDARTTDFIEVCTQAEAYQCHHYGHGQSDAWCQQKSGQIIGGYEYKWSGATGNLCGGCWCCKKPLEPELVPQSVQNGKTCGLIGDSHRSFTLENGAATFEACKATCAVTPRCVALSGEFGHWCAGCTKQLWEPQAGALAYLKVDTPSLPAVIPMPHINGKKCGNPGDTPNHRVFELTGSAATEDACHATCAITSECFAVSGIWGDWCVGCDTQLWQDHYGAMAHRKAKKSEFCMPKAASKCQNFPCIDLREGKQHHHIMWLDPANAAQAHVDGEAYSFNDNREWDCTCQGWCQGLVGTWSCPGFYSGTIKVTADYNDDFTDDRTTDSIDVCSTAAAFTVHGADHFYPDGDVNGVYFTAGMHNDKPRYGNYGNGWLAGCFIMWEDSRGNLVGDTWAYWNLPPAGVAKWTLSCPGHHKYWNTEASNTPPTSPWNIRAGYASGAITVQYQAPAFTIYGSTLSLEVINGPWFKLGNHNERPIYRNMQRSFIIWEDVRGNLNGDNFAYLYLGTPNTPKWTLSYNPHHRYHSEVNSLTPPVHGWEVRDGYTTGDIHLIYQAPTLNGPVTASSNFGWGHLPIHGIDGDQLTMHVSSWETNPWWQVDLGHPHQITTITFRNRPDWCASRLFVEDAGCLWSYSPVTYDGPSQGAEIRVSDSACSGEVCPGELCKKLTAASIDHQYTIYCNGKVGRYVSILLPGTRYLQLPEIRIEGAYDGPQSTTPAPTTTPSPTTTPVATTTPTPTYTCGNLISTDCQSEYNNALYSNNFPSFCNRCATEAGSDPLRNRCMLCCDHCQGCHDLSGTYMYDTNLPSQTVTITQTGCSGWGGWTASLPNQDWTHTVWGTTVMLHHGLAGTISGPHGSYVIAWSNGFTYTQATSTSPPQACNDFSNGISYVYGGTVESVHYNIASAAACSVTCIRRSASAPWFSWGQAAPSKGTCWCMSAIVSTPAPDALLISGKSCETSCDHFKHGVSYTNGHIESIHYNILSSAACAATCSHRSSSAPWFSWGQSGQWTNTCWCMASTVVMTDATLISGNSCEASPHTCYKPPSSTVSCGCPTFDATGQLVFSDASCKDYHKTTQDSQCFQDKNSCESAPCGGIWCPLLNAWCGDAQATGGSCFKDQVTSSAECFKSNHFDNHAWLTLAVQARQIEINHWRCDYYQSGKHPTCPSGYAPETGVTDKTCNDHNQPCYQVVKEPHFTVYCNVLDHRVTR